MGDVVSGKHSVSLSAWSWFIERDSFLDFVPVVKGTIPTLRQQRDWVPHWLDRILDVKKLVASNLAFQAFEGFTGT